mmetsp:Transcript_13803/g.41705  ORF Transcript_13803/g.41705 Transcript_13803/m.41705 type:complete len:200 (-) Transcript_13803:1141-1740(-)
MARVTASRYPARVALKRLRHMPAAAAPRPMQMILAAMHHPMATPALIVSCRAAMSGMPRQFATMVISALQAARRVRTIKGTGVRSHSHPQWCHLTCHPMHLLMTKLPMRATLRHRLPSMRLCSKQQQNGRQQRPKRQRQSERQQRNVLQLLWRPPRPSKQRQKQHRLSGCLRRLQHMWCIHTVTLMTPVLYPKTLPPPQ